MRKVKAIITMIGAVLILFSCGNNKGDKPTPPNQNPQLKNFALEGITIGAQTWASANLDVSTFRNGDPITEVIENDQWIKYALEKKPACCYYGNVPTIGKKYGKLYNWFAVNDPRGLAPKGWHIPTGAEWTALTNFLGGDSVAGCKLKSTVSWTTSGETNSSGFDALGGGHRDNEGGFNNIGASCYWWTSTPGDSAYSWIREIWDKECRIDSSYGDMTMGFYIRCIKDK